MKSMSESEIDIQVATPGDVHELVILNRLFNGFSDSAEEMAIRMQNTQNIETIILARLEGQVAGFAALRVLPCVLYPTPYAELTELYVKEEYRLRGIATHLVRFLEKLAVKKGAKSLSVQTGADNQPALSLYYGLDFADYDVALQKSLR